MGLNKPIIITSSAVDTSNLATKSDMTTLQNSLSGSITTLQSNVTSALANVGGAVKKIQRGTSNSLNAITLSGFTNVDKMVVHLEGFYSASKHANTGVVGADSLYVSALTASKLTIGSSEIGSDSIRRDKTFSYTVIEYY